MQPVQRRMRQVRMRGYLSSAYMCHLYSSSRCVAVYHKNFEALGFLLLVRSSVQAYPTDW